MHEARTADFAERILDLDIGWWGESRIDTMLALFRPLLGIDARQRLRMVFMGAESGFG